MQDPNADTEWNDVLRAKGILPQKEAELTEDDIVDLLEQTVEEKTQGKSFEDMTKDELDDIEDEIDEEEERLFEEYRRKRLEEMREAQRKAVFGEVREISKADWVTEVNKAGDGLWVALLIYKNGIPLCKLMNEHWVKLASKFPRVKFLRGQAVVCIPNYPDKHLPTVFLYNSGELRKQWVGALEIGDMRTTVDEIEWRLSKEGVVETDLEEAPRPAPRDAMTSALIDSDDD